MKKILIRVCLAVLVLIILAALSIHFFLDGAVKRGVETIGPKLTKVDVKLDSVSISLLSGSGKIKGMVIGNPEGYKTPQAISVGSATLALQPSSLLADKLIIHQINLESPEITFEGGLKGNNLKKILANMNENSSGAGSTNIAGATPKEEKKASKKLQVDDFAITGAKVTASINELGGKPMTITLPPIHLTNLGTGPDGITPTELSKQVLAAIENATVEAVANSPELLNNLTKGLTKGLGTNANETLKGIGNLFKKKQ